MTSHNTVGTDVGNAPDESGARNVLAMVKNDERYVFLYDSCAASRQLLLRTLVRFAADRELSFTEYDAAVLSQRAGDLWEQEKAEKTGETDFPLEEE